MRMIVAKAWMMLAPFGVETTDIRRLVDKTLRECVEDERREMKKKLIEVALPLEAINKESAREKSIRHGHPSTLHLWWARRPLAACRAVLFASLVDDPSSLPEQFPTEADQDKERQRLFRLIEKLVLWENSNNRAVLDEAHAEILKSTGGNPPPIYDPFCGGGSIPLEAQRLGLEAHGSDLNPVAVLITKALIEIPPKFAGQPPVNPAAKEKMSGKGMWTGARGLADDVRYYGQWMRDRAFERIGHLYPKVKLPKSTAVARQLSSPGSGREPLNARIQHAERRCRWCARSRSRRSQGRRLGSSRSIDHASEARTFRGAGAATDRTRGHQSRRGASRCLFCGNVVPLDHIRADGPCHGDMDAQLMAIVAEGDRGRDLSGAEACEHEEIADISRLAGAAAASHNPANGSRLPGTAYRISADLFTPRQLVALTTFSDLGRRSSRARPFATGQVRDTQTPSPPILAFAVDKAADR